jgi:hypothetical protein
MRISCVLLAIAFVMAAARPASSCPRSRQAPCCCGDTDDEPPEQTEIERTCCCVRGSNLPAPTSSAPVAQSPVRPEILPPAVAPVAVVTVPAAALSLLQPPPAPRALSPPTLVAMHALLLC